MELDEKLDRGSLLAGTVSYNVAKVPLQELRRIILAAWEAVQTATSRNCTTAGGVAARLLLMPMAALQSIR